MFVTNVSGIYAVWRVLNSRDAGPLVMDGAVIHNMCEAGADYLVKFEDDDAQYHYVCSQVYVFMSDGEFKRKWW